MSPPHLQRQHNTFIPLYSRGWNAGKKTPLFIILQTLFIPPSVATPPPPPHPLLQWAPLPTWTTTITHCELRFPPSSSQALVAREKMLKQSCKSFLSPDTLKRHSQSTQFINFLQVEAHCKLPAPHTTTTPKTLHAARTRTHPHNSTPSRHHQHSSPVSTFSLAHSLARSWLLLSYQCVNLTATLMRLLTKSSGDFFLSIFYFFQRCRR